MKQGPLLLTLSALLLGTGYAQGVPASYPVWWIEYGLIRLDRNHQDTQSTVNQGQAKYFTQQVILYLNNRLELLSGATFNLDELLPSRDCRHGPLLTLSAGPTQAIASSDAMEVEAGTYSHTTVTPPASTTITVRLVGTVTIQS